jgi:oligoendopeptidase F
LTSEFLSEAYGKLNTKYFGKHVETDADISLEWSRIPHFYSPFYVYQYATGYSAAASLAGMITTQGEPARERYIEFLKSGGSDYPIELLKRAGVDMSMPKPIEDALALFEKTLAEMESLLA